MKCFEQSAYEIKMGKRSIKILGKIGEANLDYRLSKKSSKDKDDYIKTINEALEGNLK
tara:strand:- start:1400 stop:1573 length:174 start_codon:yes stop_codon:yes gene_type:complete